MKTTNVICELTNKELNEISGGELVRVCMLINGVDRWVYIYQ